jgi:hypothetical protein
MTGSHLTYTRSGVWIKEMRGNMKELMGDNRTEAADLCAGHFVARRSKPHLGGFSFLAPRGWPKSLAAPSAVIHEMPSMKTERSLMFAYVRLKSLMFAFFEKKVFFSGVVVGECGYTTGWGCIPLLRNLNPPILCYTC